MSDRTEWRLSPPRPYSTHWIPMTGPDAGGLQAIPLTQGRQFRRWGYGTGWKASPDQRVTHPLAVIMGVAGPHSVLVATPPWSDRSGARMGWRAISKKRTELSARPDRQAEARESRGDTSRAESTKTHASLAKARLNRPVVDGRVWDRSMISRLMDLPEAQVRMPSVGAQPAAKTREQANSPGIVKLVCRSGLARCWARITALRFGAAA